MNKTKKLSLDRATLRSLAETPLATVAAGAPATGSEGLRCTLGCTQNCSQGQPCTYRCF